MANHFGQTIDDKNRILPLHLYPQPTLYFYGREEILSEIHTAVQTCKYETNSYLRTIVIQGFGGIGKSEIARVYAQRYHNDYDYIVWFDAQSEISLISSFAKLAKRLGISCQKNPDVSDVYQKLANTYKRGIFIFENAEGLKTNGKNDWIEEYLHMDFLPKKPIFIVTTQFGSNSWASIKTKIKIISVDRLSLDDTYQCVKKYLHLDIQKLPPYLEDSIHSIAKTLDGYPLALSLASTTMGKPAEKTFFEEILSRVNGYMELLQVTPINHIYNDSDYEERLNLIFEATTKRLHICKNGSTAIDLLAIMSHLNTHEITLKILYAIFSCQYYDGVESLEIKDQNYLHAIKLRHRYSLVKIYDEEIKPHRLIQKSAQIISTKKAITSIVRFFEKNSSNKKWRGHLQTIYNALIGGASVENKPYFLNMLEWNLNPEQITATFPWNPEGRHIGSKHSFVAAEIPHQGNSSVLIPDGTSIANNSLTGDEKTYVFLDHTGRQRDYSKPLARLKSRLCFSLRLTINDYWNWNGTPGGSTKAELKIMSIKDFQLLEPFHTSVDISKIDEKYEDKISYFRSSGENVKEIIISGSISSEWFYYVMRQFPAARSLTIDMDKFCTQRISEDALKGKSIAITTIVTYTVKNFKRCTSDVSKFFLSLSLPNIKYFLIENSSLIPERYESLEFFLQHHAKLFQLVTFQRCFI
ncbi:unnamed protein product, partial [Allacma fusca]